MQEGPDRRVFRPAALRRYMHGSQTPVSPGWAVPRWFGLSWLLIAALLAGAIALWSPLLPFVTPALGE